MSLSIFEFKRLNLIDRQALTAEHKSVKFAEVEFAEVEFAENDDRQEH